MMRLESGAAATRPDVREEHMCTLFDDLVVQVFEREEHMCTLSADLVVQVFEGLGFEDRCRSMAVCCGWRDMGALAPHLWTEIVLEQACTAGVARLLERAGGRLERLTVRNSPCEVKALSKLYENPSLQHIDLTGCGNLSAAKLVRELLHGRVLDSLSLDGCDLRECKLEELQALVPSGHLDVDICMSCRKIARLNDWETCSACSPCFYD